MKSKGFFLYAYNVKIHQFRSKHSKIKPYPMCLGNILKDTSVDNIQKKGLKGYIKDFSVDYDDINISDIEDIHKYLMKKHNIT